MNPNQPQTQLDVGPSSFAKLPLELQRKIWEYAAITPSRVIQVETACERDDAGYVPDIRDVIYQTPTECSPTSLLETCLETQTIAMKNYKHSAFNGRPLFYNPDRDILWVRGNPLVVFIPNTLAVEETIGFREVLFDERTRAPLGPYLFRSVALDFAGIKASRKCGPGWMHQRPHRPLVRLYAVSGAKVEKLYIVYSSGDRRDEVDREVKRWEDDFDVIAEGSYLPEMIRAIVEEKNKRDGTNLTRWKAPSIEAILDTWLLEPIQTLHCFPRLPLELQREIWKYAAILHYRPLEIEMYVDDAKHHDDGSAAFRNRVTTPPHPTALFQTCREPRAASMMKHDRLHFANRPSTATKTKISSGSTAIPYGKLLAINLRSFAPAQIPLHLRYKLRRMFATHHVAQGIALEKVYLAYSDASQKEEAENEADLLARYLEGFENLDPSMFKAAIAPPRRHLGIEIKMPLVEAILETDLFQARNDSSWWRKERTCVLG
ncbi:hypothetical protein DSL72_003704 [Monilinia vaccinii-corymbosi]|uniref:2EXR domain-containing protein n=1 Tax=Monilinia vaccinii-corymbosi TaxID=61207 RepID=A0A8A3NUR2_9HELO|nr:hypothetical protein DSL72_003704 [Monilinia vaccinii-corymbosi]